MATAAATATAFAALIGTAPEASAAGGPERCPAGKLCVFRYPDFAGEMKVLSGSQSQLGDWNDKISSYVNNSPMYVSWYQSPGYVCRPDCFPMTSPRSGAHAFLYEFDNTISSVRASTSPYEMQFGTRYMPWRVTPSQYRTEPLPAVARFGDLDGDRRPDLLERTFDGQLWFLPGDGKGRLIGGGWNSMTQLVRHGDQNGDGREDLFARDTAGVLWLYPGRGDGTFGRRIKAGTAWNGMREISAVGDVTGDGKGDLLARDTAGVLWRYAGNGKGGLAPRVRIGAGWNTYNTLVAPGDVTGDGRADLLARDTARGLWLYAGDGRGGFAARTKLTSVALSRAQVLVSTGDVTGDGRSDLVQDYGGNLVVHPGSANGRFGHEPGLDFDSHPNTRLF
ncbi:FG-GAP-like repeat-containing protein [Streptomyces sp. NPDC097619]|uniref:FG-GAP-like repeat-containing protein n=1 Tax=Streptomyces sp. NPDC097619 TaxID=3157228 RepID=UPI00333136C3